MSLGVSDEVEQDTALGPIATRVLYGAERIRVWDRGAEPLFVHLEDWTAGILS